MNKIVILLVATIGCSQDSNPCAKGWVLDATTDKGACYRECVLAATKSEQPGWNTDFCVRKLCTYKRYCPK